MKSHSLALFAVAFAVVCLFSACGGETAFDAREIAFLPEQTVQSPAPADRTLPVGDAERSFVYQYDETVLSGEVWEVYRSADGVEARFCKQNGSLSVTSPLATPIAPASGSPATEEDFLALVREWTGLLAPEADLSSYRYACTTTYFAESDTEGYGESLSANQFYRPGDGEKADGYLFAYTAFCGDVPTETGVTVETDGKGNLLAFRYDGDPAYADFPVDDREISDTVDAYLSRHERSAGHDVREWEVAEKHFAVVDGETALSVTVLLTCEADGETFPDALSLYLTPKA